ncbi:hypothetical protein Asera_22320 [Actinocatenispora sera]|uniref:Uncharacterized protein n=1 Tax=Actinocatenispora sera TaxID=390989 RepID=A0A810KYE1_9ACTN|nr:hypothetical protein Asera_22320 [Actinocatenispora sera]
MRRDGTMPVILTLAHRMLLVVGPAPRPGRRNAPGSGSPGRSYRSAVCSGATYGCRDSGAIAIKSRVEQHAATIHGAESGLPPSAPDQRARCLGQNCTDQESSVPVSPEYTSVTFSFQVPLRVSSEAFTV